MSAGERGIWQGVLGWRQGLSFPCRSVALPEAPAPEWFVIDLFENTEQAAASRDELVTALAASAGEGASSTTKPTSKRCAASWPGAPSVAPLLRRRLGVEWLGRLWGRTVHLLRLLRPPGLVEGRSFTGWPVRADSYSAVRMRTSASPSQPSGSGSRPSRMQSLKASSSGAI